MRGVMLFVGGVGGGVDEGWVTAGDQTQTTYIFVPFTIVILLLLSVNLIKTINLKRIYK